MTPQVLAIITTIGGLVIPPAVSLLKKEKWSAQVKQLIAGILSAGVAAGAVAIVAPQDFGLPLVTLAGLIYAGSQVVYGLYFKGSRVDTILSSVGSKPPAA